MFSIVTSSRNDFLMTSMIAFEIVFVSEDIVKTSEPKTNEPKAKKIILFRITVDFDGLR